MITGMEPTIHHKSLIPLKQYGVIKQNECDNSYPLPYVSISSDDYDELANEDASAKVAKVQYNYVSKASLEALKAALDKGHRVLIGFNLQSNSQAVRGFDAIVGSVKKSGGLWACQQPSSKTNYCVSPQAGHEVVVIGYDDAQQLVKIRNSSGCECRR